MTQRLTPSPYRQDPNNRFVKCRLKQNYRPNFILTVILWPRCSRRSKPCNVDPWLRSLEAHGPSAPPLHVEGQQGGRLLLEARLLLQPCVVPIPQLLRLLLPHLLLHLPLRLLEECLP